MVAEHIPAVVTMLTPLLHAAALELLLKLVTVALRLLVNSVAFTRLLQLCLATRVIDPMRLMPLVISISMMGTNTGRTEKLIRGRRNPGKLTYVVLLTVEKLIRLWKYVHIQLMTILSRTPRCLIRLWNSMVTSSMVSSAIRVAL